ncbi:hypothetical protein N752_24750 [Desulforamulus aquiferis]|nr:hypothetical protein N752_24750 [Desulforamulus aquiferis]
MSLGAGRATKDAAIDLSVGLVLKKKIGEGIGKGEIIAELHAAKGQELLGAEDMVRKAYTIGHNKPAVREIVLGRV